MINSLIQKNNFENQSNQRHSLVNSIKILSDITYRDAQRVNRVNVTESNSYEHNERIIDKKNFF